VPARGAIHSASGQLRASCWPTLRPVREVHSLDWDRRARVIPASKREIFAPRLGRAYRIERPATSQEAWPEVEPKGPTPRRQEPCGTPTGERIEADKLRKLRTLVCGDARRIAGCGGFRNTFAGVPLPFFFVIVRPSSLRGAQATKQSGLNKEWDCFAEPVIGPATSGRTRWLAMTRRLPRTQHAPRER
jgi:hypothetical protein